MRHDLVVMWVNPQPWLGLVIFVMCIAVVCAAVFSGGNKK